MTASPSPHARTSPFAAPSPSTNPIDRRLALVRAMSGDIHKRGSPSGKSPQISAGRRKPLFPLPPAIDSPGRNSSDDELPNSAARLSLKRVRSFHGTPSRLSAASVFERQRDSFHGANSPFARAPAAPSPRAPSRAPSFGSMPPIPIEVEDLSDAPFGGSGAFRPPPIRTVASLDGWASSSTPPEARRAAPSPIALDRPPPPPIRTGSSPDTLQPDAALAPSLFGAMPIMPIAPPPTPRGFGGFGGRRFSGSAGGFGRREGESSPHMSLVAPSLYVGDEHAASSPNALAAANVTHVLNASSLANPLEGHAGAPAHYMQLGLLDTTADLPMMQEALATGVEFISEAIANGGVVLVHCHRGISRSATLAIAYLVRSMQLPAEMVFEQMRGKRRVIDPNLGYWVSLKEWERRVLPPAILQQYSSPTTGAPPPLTPGGGLRA